MVSLLKLPIRLLDLLERRRRLCEYILININGRALWRKRKLTGKYDVIPPKTDKSDAPDKMCSAISPFVENARGQDQNGQRGSAD